MARAGLRPALIGLALACLAGVLWSRPAAAEPPRPVITTPTPVPTPTPSALERRRTWLLTPEAQRQGGFYFVPLIVRGGPRPDINPDRFLYTVRPGDSLWSLALDSGRDLDTLACAATPIGPVSDALVAGRSITIPALADLCYTVTPGDTLAGIAARHGLTVAQIVAVAWNGFTTPPHSVIPQQRVLLPGARPAGRPRLERSIISVAEDAWAGSDYRNWPFGDGKFVWPAVGPISQDAHEGHWALDIAVPTGTQIRAADRGTVVMAGWSPVGYGFRVVIDHGNDYLTLYAHLSDIYVEVGQVVGKGQVIGASGANGNVTGPHLHFELRDFGVLTDPLRYLPRQ
jgi:LysM repeat protein